MQGTLRSGWLAALAASLVLATIGCGGGGGGNGPAPTPTGTPQGTPTPAPSPTSTPTPTATVLPNPFPIATGLTSGTGPAVGWDDGRYLVTFSQLVARTEPDLVGLRLSPDGVVVDAAPLLLSDLGSDPFLGPATAVYGNAAIASGGADGFGVFFLGGGTVGAAGPPGEIVGFTSVPTVGPPLLPATEVETQASFSMALTFITGPLAAAASGDGSIGLFQYNFSMVGSFSVNQLQGDFVTVTGGSVGVQPTGAIGGAAIPPVAGLADSSAPGVASTDSATLAAWVESLDTQQSASTYLAAAALAPGEVRRIRLSDATPGSQGVAIASDGASFLVVWTAAAASDPSTRTEIRAIRVVLGGGAGGSDLIEPPGGFLVAGGSSPKALAGVAFGGGTYLVAWLEDGAVSGARVPEDDSTAAPFTIDPGPANAAALTSDDERFLVVFERPVDATTSDLMATFVDAVD
jgi:hypothetical protein